jgi:hypothetical protein
MAFNVSDFRSSLVGDGARGNLFQVTIIFPASWDSNFSPATGNAIASQKLQFMAKSSQLPGSSLGVATLPYFGRELKFAGNRTFADWSITIINDEDFQIRKSLEGWANGINSHVNNVRSSLAVSPSDYTIDGKVDQFDKTGNIIKTYNFIGMFPTDISPIELDWGNNDSIEEYSVTFAYQWWESDTTS